MEAAIRFRLREARETRRLTQQEVADLMGMTRDYYQKVESGIRSVNLSFVQRFCLAMKVPVSQVITDAGDAEMLIETWPQGYKILRRAAEGPAWQRERLQKLFEIIYGNDNGHTDV